MWGSRASSSRHQPITIGLALAVLFAVTSCGRVAQSSDPTPASIAELISIENEPGPFCGRCDSVKVTAYSDGRALIEHSYWTDPECKGVDCNLVTQRYPRRITSDQFRHFRDQLQPFRPVGRATFQDKPPCRTLLYDVDGVRVQWRGAGPDAELVFNFGCDPQDRRDIAKALREAPAKLGIPKLWMPWDQWTIASPA